MYANTIDMTFPSGVGVVDAMTPSESAEVALHGHKAKTPMIAGIVSGACVGAAWIVGFIIYFYKRHRREKRARALGFKSHREMLDPPKKQEAFIIPPDPAIVEAGHHPGERIYDDPAVQGSDLPKHAHTLPLAEVEKATDGIVEPGLAPPAPAMPHSASAPEKVADAPRERPSGSTERTLPSPPSPRRISSEMVIPKDV